MPKDILRIYGLPDESTVTPYGKGLINHTWKVITPTEEYILQKINHQVFTQPHDIAHNIQLISDHLERTEPDYFLPRPLPTTDGKQLTGDSEKGYFRLFPFVKDSVTVDTADNSDHAFEAARQFGTFTRLLSAMPVDELKITIRDFHNLGLRYKQFLDALQHGNILRIKEANELVDSIAAHDFIVSRYQHITNSEQFKLRVAHHDTKISNVLFNRKGKGICVVDLDTTMPGYFISDVGDMMRTYLSPANEEEKDLHKIEIRNEYFEAIVEGYLPQMENVLTEEEIDSFVYSGVFMTYMQAIRFLTDYLNNDIYYGSAYEGHNLVRAGNQFTLLERLLQKQNDFKKMVQKKGFAVG